jgi:UDP-glucose 4-epimerase
LDEFIKKNILILGGSGFLGKNIGKSLLSDDNNIIIFDIVNSWNDIDPKNTKIYPGCLSDFEYLTNVIKENKITVIIHCVSYMLPNSDIDSYIVDINENLIPTVKIIDYCSHNNIQFVYLSSGGAIYGNKKGLINEDDSLSPISYYGFSKRQTEETILFHHNKYNLSFLILRPSNPFGYGQNLYGKQGLISVLIGKILNNEPVHVFGNGETLRDYIYIDDFTYYIKKLLDHGIANTIINIGSGKGYTINEIIKILEGISGKKMNVIYSPSRDNDVLEIVLDISRLNKLVQHKQADITAAISEYYNKIING